MNGTDEKVTVWFGGFGQLGAVMSARVGGGGLKRHVRFALQL